MTHDTVFEAAVVAIPHEKWLGRPLACMVLKEGYAEAEEMKAELLTYMEWRFAGWRVPDAVVFLKKVPKTPVGKFFKAALRKELDGCLRISLVSRLQRLDSRVISQPSCATENTSLRRVVLCPSDLYSRLRFSFT